jgi:hypothetical protein
MLATFALSATLSLVQVFLDSLRLSEKERSLVARTLDETAQHFHRFLKLACKLRVLVILPGIAQGGKPGLERGHRVLEVAVESLQFLGKLLQLIRIYYRFRHADTVRVSRCFWQSESSQMSNN